MLHNKLSKRPLIICISLVLSIFLLNIFFTTDTLAQIKRIGVDKNSEKDTQIPRSGNDSKTPKSGENSQISRAKGENSLRFNASTRIERIGLQQSGEATLKIISQTEPLKPPPGPESFVVKANQLTKAGNFQEAIKLYNKAIQTRPQLVNARLGLGNTFIQMGNYNEALSQYTHAIDVSPNNAEAYLNLGVAFYGKKDVDQAITSFEKALSINTKSFPVAHFNLAIAWSHQGNYEKAITHYLQAIEQDKTLSEAYNNLGLVYEALGEKEKALMYFQSAIKQENGKYPLAHYNLGRFYQNQAERNKAIEAFQLAIKNNPNFVEAHLDLANLYLFRSIAEKTNEYETAIANYKKAIELNKGFYPLAYENLAITLAKQGKLSEALQNYRVAFKQYQGKCPDTLSNLLVTLTNQPIYSINNELSLADNVNNIKYEKPKATIDERVLLELEKYDDLDEELKNQANIRYCIGLAYLALGKLDEAKEELSKASLLSQEKDKDIQEALSIATKNKEK